jgi:serralysin
VGNRTEYDFCGALLIGEVISGKPRAALVRGAKWNPGDRIEVCFLDGIPSVQERVKAFAKEWTTPGLANLRFVFRRKPAATPIRISFKYRGRWSAIGKECFSPPYTDATRPTMNFGGFSEDTPDETMRAVVLHEFGHALGLTHEHMSPAARIHWNEEQVYADLSGPPNHWSREIIRENIFEVHEDTNYTKFDPTSIMLYPIKNSWNFDGLEVGWNNDLSPTDRAFIRQQYP